MSRGVGDNQGQTRSYSTIGRDPRITREHVQTVMSENDEQGVREKERRTVAPVVARVVRGSDERAPVLSVW